MIAGLQNGFFRSFIFCALEHGATKYELMNVFPLITRQIQYVIEQESVDDRSNN